ncbi:MAG TPA: TetR/AcrR family transcriptional regulator [Aggregatilineaceae bacterium]|nr:TetR/AcrR family transcriptional regulator [Aggregatilineaceae bacterium]
MSTNAVRLDPRVKRTRQLLQRALAELLSEKTFQNITVQDIAERAEVNRATFYAHFQDKYALLNYSVRGAFQERVDRRLPATPTLTPENLRVLTLIVCEYLSEFLGHCVPSSPNGDQAVLVRQVQAQCYEVILEWVVRTWGDPARFPLSPEVVAMVTSWAIFGSVLQWVVQGRRLAPEQLADQVLRLLESGLQSYLS